MSSIDLIAVHNVAVIQRGGFGTFCVVDLLGNGIDNEDFGILGIKTEFKLGDTGENRHACETDMGGNGAVAALKDTERGVAPDRTDELAGVAFAVEGYRKALVIGDGKDGAIGKINGRYCNVIAAADFVQLSEEGAAFQESADGAVDEGNYHDAKNDEAGEGVGQKLLEEREDRNENGQTVAQAQCTA